MSAQTFQTDRAALLYAVHEIRNAITPAVVLARRNGAAKDVLELAAEAIERCADLADQIAAHLDAAQAVQRAGDVVPADELQDGVLGVVVRGGGTWPASRRWEYRLGEHSPLPGGAPVIVVRVGLRTAAEVTAAIAEGERWIGILAKSVLS
jgi:hypothetical protein